MKYLALLLVLFVCSLCYAQPQSNTVVNINTCSDTSLFVASKPILFCSADQNFYIWNGSAWINYPSGSGGGNSVWTFVTKPATETRTGTTVLADDASLQFPVVANGAYQLRMTVIWSAAATPDFKFAINGAASPVSVACATYNNHAANPTAFVVQYESSYGVARSVVSSGSTGVLQYDCNILNGINAGTVAFQWAQNTSDAGATQVLIGSYIQYRKSN